jgi:two-component system sensor histidine kinase YesM
MLDFKAGIITGAETMKVLKKVSRRFNDLKIRDKIFICFVLIILVSVLSVGISSYYKSSAILGDRTSKYNFETVQQISTGVDYTLQRIDDLSGILAFDQNIQQLLSTDLGHMSESERIRAVHTIESIMITHFNGQIMRSIEIYGDNGLVVKVPSSYNDSENETEIKQHLAKAAEFGGKVKWLNQVESEGLLRAVRQINELQTGTNPIGTVIISLKYETIANLLKKVNFDNSGSVLLVDENQYPITPSDLLNTHVYATALTKSIAVDSSGSSIQTLDGKQYLVSFETSQYTGWKTVGVISVSRLYKDSHTIRVWLIVVTLVILLFAFLLARVFAETITLPIKRMLKPMKKVQMGDIDVTFPVNGNDEIGILSSGMNQMINQIHTLIEDAYKGKIMLQESQFKVLQAQINPHFLYNTLESINWMAKMNGVDQICQMVSALGDLMRISINSEKEYITVEEEMKYIGDYLYIQKSRFGDRIQSEISIDKELLPVVIPKLILQPIVENALLHGVQVKKGKGMIHIKGSLQNGCILFEVEDNGVGMTQERVALLFSNEDGEVRGKAIGVRNVHGRIQYIYGNGYGVEIYSRLGEGTKVQIRVAPELPMEEKR